MSGGGMIAFGALFIAIGVLCLVFSEDLLTLYRKARRSRELVNILSAYVVPAIFVAAGIAMIAVGTARAT